MEYKVEDRILGTLNLGDPCPIRIVDDGKFVKLYVGPRDWQWRKDSGKLVGFGTCLCQEVPTEEG